MAKRIRIGALISGSGTNLKAIIDACNNGRIDGDLVFVGGDTPDAAGFRWAIENQIPTFAVNYSDIIRKYRKNPASVTLPGACDIDAIISKQRIFPSSASSDQLNTFFTTRLVAEEGLLSRMSVYPFDLLVLAGFMRNLTPYFIDSVNTNPLHPRIMNIHPALLPAFPGIDGYGDTFRYGCKVGGCTVHFVDYGEDSGPIIAQKSFEIHPDDTLAMVRKRGLELEWALYPRCVQWFAADRLRVEKSTSTLSDGRQQTRTVVRII
jgi:phosphoribosylglycinamide formyltransferase-1